ncbi:MAG: 6-phosphofructokinase [Myxococcota bacterium]
MRVGVLTSGGDAPGMNAAIRAIVKGAAAGGGEVLGVRRGYEGLLAGDAGVLGLAQVDGASRHGGTLLGSARSKRFPTEEGLAAAAAQVTALGLDGLVIIGGNGSLTGALRLSERVAVPVVGVPASIDNDLGHTALSIGVDTAVNTIVDACDRISDTATAHRRVFVVEVMGRSCGFLAMRAGVAADADAIVVPERDRDPEAIVARCTEVLRRSFRDGRDKERVLVVKAEGVPLATAALVAALQAVLDRELPGVDVRETVLGHVVRGGNPSALDRLLAQRLGYGALRAVQQGVGGVMAAWEAEGDVGLADDAVGALGGAGGRARRDRAPAGPGGRRWRRGGWR